ncbi:hypothetical protein BGZ82_000991 [Podila clonocystis]|nr:hypothetical protein BGZ82_000991 [Podila clonocystis]
MPENPKFRIQEPDYEQDGHNGCKIMYGLKEYKAMDQPLHGIAAKEDRCIAFPHIYQHQVRLLSHGIQTRQTTILSPTNIPPQQKEWAPRTDLQEEVVRRLPQELVDQIDKPVD